MAKTQLKIANMYSYLGWFVREMQTYHEVNYSARRAFRDHEKWVLRSNHNQGKWRVVVRSIGKFEIQSVIISTLFAMSKLNKKKNRPSSKQ